MEMTKHYLVIKRTPESKEEILDCATQELAERTFEGMRGRPALYHELRLIESHARTVNYWKAGQSEEDASPGGGVEARPLGL